MYITGPLQIFNVWANDAHAVSVIVTLLFMPLVILFVIPWMIKWTAVKSSADGSRGFFKKIVSMRITIVSMLAGAGFLAGAAGTGQFFIPIHLVDAAVRAMGVSLFTLSTVLFAIFYHAHNLENNRKGFYLAVRHPDLVMLFALLLGLSLATVSLFSTIVVLFILLPMIIGQAVKKEKLLLEQDDTYIEYKTSVPMFIPAFKKYIRQQIFGKDEDS
jgi:protein-S-isoprenylcysteine O-methyltransferase Ste14